MSSLTAPPHFNGENYAYWKVRMRAFLKSLDERVWNAVVRGWTRPETNIDDWTKEEITNCNWNSKGLNAIFMAVSPEEFKRISMCEIAKEAWDILEVTHEGTKIVKNSKLQLLTSKFEEIKMLEEESFDDFYSKLNDIVNSRFNLGEKVEDSRVVRKILRSLPERFRPKVTAIEESKDLDAIKVEELVGSLQTYESSLPQTRKGKSIALKTIEENYKNISDEESLNDEEIALLARKFRKFMFNKESGKQKQRKNVFAKKNETENWKKEKTEKKDKVQCHECSGYGHIRVECPNFKKNKGKALNVTLSDSSDSENSSSDDEKSFMAFSTIVNDFPDITLTKSESSCEYSDSNVSVVEADQELSLQEAYNDVCEEVIKLKKLNKKLYKKFTDMESEKNNLSEALKVSENEIARLENQNTALEKELKKVEEKTATQKLEEMLSLQKMNSDRTGLGYTTSKGKEKSASSSAATTSKGIVFVKGSQGKSFQNHAELKSVYSKNLHDKFVPTCHKCGIIGHIRPHCFNLNQVQKSEGKRKEKSLQTQVDDISQQISLINLKLGELADICLQNKEKHKSILKTKWVRKKDAVCLVAHTALKSKEDCLWYLDSGCSRHMSGDKNLFKKIEASHGGTVTFGDGSKAVIEGKGSIEIPGLPVLHDVLFVNGLKANLLSISQFCDNDFSVQFSKDACNLYDKGGE
ncbi:hypothetical protein I3760_15G130800 [Carya illinoinensis]|nr:hypothetical protein I3760_15G130800 [Carya illinoinensis]